jgi:hypothetical protein
MAGRAETIGTKGLPSSTILLRTLTVLPRSVMAMRIIRLDTSFQNRQWSTQIKLTSTHKKLIRNQTLPLTKQEKQLAHQRRRLPVGPSEVRRKVRPRSIAAWARLAA